MRFKALKHPRLGWVQVDRQELANEVKLHVLAEAEKLRSKIAARHIEVMNVEYAHKLGLITFEESVERLKKLNRKED